MRFLARFILVVLAVLLLAGVGYSIARYLTEAETLARKVGDQGTCMKAGTMVVSGGPENVYSCSWEQPDYGAGCFALVDDRAVDVSSRFGEFETITDEHAAFNCTDGPRAPSRP